MSDETVGGPTNGPEGAYDRNDPMGEAKLITKNTTCSSRLQKWECHKVVEAGRIVGMHKNKLGVVNEHDIPIDVVCTDEWLGKHNPEVGGYFVRYKDGYTSYSPAEAFKEGYSLLDEADRDPETPTSPFVFSTALKFIKTGFRVTRTGWNGKGMWLEMQVPDEHSKMTLPYIYMRTAQGDLVPWLASQTDLLADDWMLHE